MYQIMYLSNVISSQLITNLLFFLIKNYSVIKNIIEESKNTLSFFKISLTGYLFATNKYFILNSNNHQINTFILSKQIGLKANNIY